MELRFDSAAAACGPLAPMLLAVPQSVKRDVQEIRFRAGKPIALSLSGKILFLTGRGELVHTVTPGCFFTDRPILETLFRQLCSFSVYSHQSEIQNGYIALRGGHRAGICGTAVLSQGKISGIRNISSINLRIAREIRGVADALVVKGEALLGGLLLVGPPCCGKTTVLRDLARQLSEARKKVAVIDERGEFAGVWEGEPQNDLGPCCDVLDGYPKQEGMLQAIRVLSPEFLICDELGGAGEVEAVLESLYAGVSVIASLHAGSVQELLRRPQAAALLQTGAFQTVALMDGRAAPGKIIRWMKAGDLLENRRDSDGDRGVCVHRLEQGASARAAG